MPTLLTQQLEFNLQNVIDGNGISIAVTGMLIVFVALVTISLFLSALPRLLAVLERYYPQQEHHHGTPAATSTTSVVAQPVTEEMLVAIAVALRERRQSADLGQRL